MHSNAESARHDIIFTAGELNSYGKRLWGLKDRGFDLQFVNGEAPA